MDLPPGLAARYRVVEVLGAGAMGVVLRCIQLALEREVALKLPTLTSAEHVARFVREGRILSRLDHPNLVRVYDAGDEGGQPFIAFELVQGRTLKAIVEAGRLSPGEAAELVIGLLTGLDHAHESGVIHRDIKSENALATFDGVVKLVDFGLAWSEAETQTTKTGLLMGSPSYMAPEQAQGQRVDRRADLYSAGIVLYELLTGRLPFEADDIGRLLYQQIHDAPPPLSGHCPQAPATLERLVARVLAKDPKDRFASAADFAQRLRAAVGPLALAQARDSLPALLERSGPQVTAGLGSELTVIGTPGSAGGVMRAGLPRHPAEVRSSRGASRASGATHPSGRLRAMTRPVEPTVVDRPAVATTRRTTLIAGVAAGLIGVGAILWWRSPPPPRPAMGLVTAGPSIDPRQTATPAESAQRVDFSMRLGRARRLCQVVAASDFTEHAVRETLTDMRSRLMAATRKQSTQEQLFEAVEKDSKLGLPAHQLVERFTNSPDLMGAYQAIVGHLAGLLESRALQTEDRAALLAALDRLDLADTLAVYFGRPAPFNAFALAVPAIQREFAPRVDRPPSGQDQRRVHQARQDYDILIPPGLDLTRLRQANPVFEAFAQESSVDQHRSRIEFSVDGVGPGGTLRVHMRVKDLFPMMALEVNMPSRHGTIVVRRPPRPRDSSQMVTLTLREGMVPSPGPWTLSVRPSLGDLQELQIDVFDVFVDRGP